MARTRAVDQVPEAAKARGLASNTTLDELLGHEAAQARLTGAFEGLARARGAADAAEAAFALLLRLAAWGLADDRRAELREEAKSLRLAFRSASGTCPGCGHDPHLPDDDVRSRPCLHCTRAHPFSRHCLAVRDSTGKITYR